MELWIRSQNKEHLIRIKKLDVFDRNILKNTYQDIAKGIELRTMIIGNDNVSLGLFKSKERALEVLDEISNLIKNRYIVEVKPLMYPEDEKRIEQGLNIKYCGEFIMQPQQTEIHPINSNVIYYEMPEE